MKGFGKFLAIAAMAMVSYSASAELAPQWAKGTLIANAEVGISPVGAAVSADYVLVDSWWMGHFTVGGEIDLGTYTHETGLGFTPRATYGLNITEQFEVHAAVGFGLGHWSYKNGDYSSSANFTYHTELVGCRFFFADNLAVTAEVGYTYYFPDYRVGISFKF